MWPLARASSSPMNRTKAAYVGEYGVDPSRNGDGFRVSVESYYDPTMPTRTPSRPTFGSSSATKRGRFFQEVARRIQIPVGRGAPSRPRLRRLWKRMHLLRAPSPESNAERPLAVKGEAVVDAICANEPPPPKQQAAAPAAPAALLRRLPPSAWQRSRMRHRGRQSLGREDNRDRGLRVGPARCVADRFERHSCRCLLITSSRTWSG